MNSSLQLRISLVMSMWKPKQLIK